MTAQLESHHYFRIGDIVQSHDGALGTVVEQASLFAIIAWESGERTEVDQFDPRIVVFQRAHSS